MGLKDASRAYWTEIQQALSKHGFDPGAVNGRRGAMTDAAIIRFKQARGLRGRAYVGPLTEAALMEEPTAPPAGEPSWLQVGRRYVGLAEIVGPRDDPQIVAWWTLVGAGWFDDDETPWCGAYVGGVLKEDGKAILPGAQAPRARAWEDWGQGLAGPAVGAVVTFWRESPSAGSGHVAFVVGKDRRGNLVCLGGNQGNAVSLRSFQTDRVTSYRWPSDVDAPAAIGFDGLPVVDTEGLSINEA